MLIKALAGKPTKQRKHERQISQEVQITELSDSLTSQPDDMHLRQVSLLPLPVRRIPIAPAIWEE